MKTLLITICLLAGTALTAQHKYEVLDQGNFGSVKATHIKAISEKTGKESYNVVISYRNLNYHESNSEISLSTSELLEQFKKDLLFCIEFIVQKSKEKDQRVIKRDKYTLTVNGFLNRVYIFDRELSKTWMSVRESQALLHWLYNLG